LLDLDNSLIIKQLHKKKSERRAIRPSLFFFQKSLLGVVVGVIANNFWLICTLFCVEKTLAQRPELSFPRPGTAAADTSQPFLTPPEPPDTTPLFFAFCQKPAEKLADGDTLPNALFRNYNPARRGFLDEKFNNLPFSWMLPTDFANLGTPGSAARPLFYQHFAKIGFQTGLDAFNLYETSPDRLRFYRHTRAFSEAIYTQGFGGQSDAQFRGKFSRTFDDGVNMSVQFDALNGLGQLPNHRNKNTAFAVGFWKIYGKNYQNFLIYCQNSHKQQENGGIFDENQLFGSGLPGGANELLTVQRSPIPASSLRKSDLQFTQHWSFGGAKNDSSGRQKSQFRVIHSARFGTEIFKFFDKKATLDSAFYGPIWVDERALRTFIRSRTIENRFEIALASATKNRSGGDLNLGIKHQFITLEEEPEKDRFQQFFVTGNTALKVANRLKINVLADLGLFKNIGEYSVRASTNVRLGGFGEVQVGLLQQNRQPALLSQHLRVAGIEVWQNNFKKIFENTLVASWSLPRFGTTIEARNHTSKNFVYFQKNQTPTQLSDPLNVTQLLVNQPVRWRWLRLDNQIILQKNNQPTRLHQPEWATRNSLYFEKKIFRRQMDFSAGVDFRLNQPFLPDAWQAASGQFFLQDSVETTIYPSLDVFAAFKVQNFRFFVRFDNISKFWQNNILYETYRYPELRGYLRFGVTFRWSDGKATAKTDANSSQNGGFNPTPTSRPSPF
jgi:Putative porin